MKSIRARLLLVLLGMLTLIALVMGGVTYRNVLAETEALFDYQLRQMALSLRDQGEVSESQAGALANEQLDFVVQIWTLDGRSIYATRAHEDLPSRALLGLADVRVKGEIWRTYSVATPGRVIQVAQPLATRQRLAAEAALRSVVPLLVLVPLLAGLAWWLSAMALSPLNRVAAEVKSRDDKLLQPLAEQGLPDEVSPLVNALNGLLQRLGQTLDTQRAFLSDAAHELRSPLTALKLQIESLRRAPDDDARAKAVSSLSDGIDRAARIVEQLLALARSEPGAQPPPMEPLDLSELVRQAVADTVPYALSRGSSFSLQADAPVTVRGERQGLTALVRNLADNAVRYAPPGSQVELRVSLEQGVPLLQVDDAGPGIPASERERVFDRFYRRASGGEEGTGLGLAIVRSVAAHHGATVTLGQSPLGGLQVRVRFPAP
ncbi:ATP-binding protein [Rhizobacter sp. J219]|uniref:ATP-binding protein n=1 Tax=Rhizobacter sp. J219 TaxID=2898430 RepID=UPI002151BFBF|nr:ATP-binding protein [Rhizobacter sp. J219]MCR5881349.1 ATP-binding protein [Rhizobacter sp. J219]